MFVVTNRKIVEGRHDPDALGSTPNHEGPNELRLAEVTRRRGKWHVEVVPDVIGKELADEYGLEARVDEQTGDEQPIHASRYVARKLLDRVNPKAAGRRGRGRNLLLFVHGYNNDPADVFDRAEELATLYGVEVLVFTWPANGGGFDGTLSYKSDKRDALASTGALDRVFTKMRGYLDEIHAAARARVEREATVRHGDDAAAWDTYVAENLGKHCRFTVNLMLHSMGNYVFKHLLRSGTYHGDLLLFDNIVMAAADVNNFEHGLWADRIAFRGRLFVTINEADSALRASRMKIGEQQLARLGHYPYRLDCRQATYVDFTDAPGVGTSHAYFEGDPVRENRAVKKFFHGAFNGEPAEKDLGFDAARNLYEVRGRRVRAR